ncbi:hypothetical protein BJX99DRAFT_249656 [Aspergillus californicus]
MARPNKGKTRKATKSTYTGTKKSQLSMQQEARNTEHRNLWSSNVQLRYQAVHFVSASSLEPTQETRPKSVAKETVTPGNTALMDAGCDKAMETAPGNKFSYNPDIESQISPRPALPVEIHPCTPEDSSEDEIVFRGRRSQPRPALHHDSENFIDNAPIQNPDRMAPAYTPEAIELAADALSDSATSNSLRDDSYNYVGINHNATAKSLEILDEDDILADYIANIDNSTEDESSSSSADECPIESEIQSKTKEFDSDQVLPDPAGEDIESNFPSKSPATGMRNETHISHGRSQSNRKRTEKSIFASATAFADAIEQDPYNGFDVMDFDRPSLRRKKMNKQEHFNLDDLDAELEAELMSAWNNDRLKKKSKKREREELRAQGLLGRNKDDPDLKIKYADGMCIQDLKTEIESFLLSSKNSLSLPPMTKHRRMLIHDIAHTLRLTSQSRGKGSARFPILSKTSKTSRYTQRTILQLDRVLSKERVNTRTSKAWDKATGPAIKGKRGLGNVSYMDGDVVGASAPEIGAGNKGRAMLEKMGWSTGTALGATHNKGILLPVSQVIKNSKAGLG